MRGVLLVLVAVLILIGLAVTLWVSGTGRMPAQALAGPASYVGSESCRQCHERIYAGWQQTLHALIIQDVSKKPQAIQGDWTQPYENRTFTQADVRLTHGVQWKQRYIDKDWHILPAQWIFESGKWGPTPGDPKKYLETNWIESCAQCHVVGYSTETKTWQELGIGCEACHGPGSRHVQAPAEQRAGTIINPASLPFDYSASTCGQCHTRGKSPDGKYEYPVGFRPGDILTTQHFQVVPKENKDAWWPDGSVKQHRQQYPDWKESKHARAGVTCATCHTVHEAATKFATRVSANNLCVNCHSTVSTDSVTGHAPIAGAPQHSNCIGCHMAPAGKSGERGDERVHTFKVVKPAVTVELGGGDVNKQPNACNLCHWHAGDRPADLQKALDEGAKRREAPAPGPTS